MISSPFPLKYGIECDVFADEASRWISPFRIPQAFARGFLEKQTYWIFRYLTIRYVLAKYPFASFRKSFPASEPSVRYFRIIPAARQISSTAAPAAAPVIEEDDDGEAITY